MASFAVVDASCGFAEALDTAFSILVGYKKLKWAEQIPIPVYMIEKGDAGIARRYSSEFAPYLEQEK